MPAEVRAFLAAAGVADKFPQTPAPFTLPPSHQSNPGPAWQWEQNPGVVVAHRCCIKFQS